MNAQIFIYLFLHFRRSIGTVHGIVCSKKLEIGTQASKRVC